MVFDNRIARSLPVHAIYVRREVSISAISIWYLHNLAIKRLHAHLEIAQTILDGAAPTHNDFNHRMFDWLYLFFR